MGKPFIVANVREVLDLYDKEEISFSRMVEMLNEIAEKFYEVVASPCECAVIVEGVSSSTDYYNAFHTIHPEGGFDKLITPEKDNIYPSNEAMDKTQKMFEDLRKSEIN